MDFTYQYNQSWEGVVFSTDADGLAPVGLHQHQYPSTQRLVRLVREHLLKSASSREPFLHTLDLFYKKVKSDCAERPTHEIVLAWARDSFPRVNFTWSEATGLSSTGGHAWRLGHAHPEAIKADVLHLRAQLADCYQRSQHDPHALAAPAYGVLIIAQLLRELTLTLVVHLYGEEAIEIMRNIHADEGVNSSAWEWASGRLVEKTIMGGDLHVEWRREHQGDLKQVSGLAMLHKGETYDLIVRHPMWTHRILKSLYTTEFLTFSRAVFPGAQGGGHANGAPQKEIRDDVSEVSTRVSVRELHRSISVQEMDADGGGGGHEEAKEAKEKMVREGKLVRMRATEVLHHKASPPNTFYTASIEIDEEKQLRRQSSFLSQHSHKTANRMSYHEDAVGSPRGFNAVGLHGGQHAHAHCHNCGRCHGCAGIASC